MAGNTVNIELKVQDTSGSLKARTKEAKTLNAELDKIPTGTKTGGKAVKASYMAAGVESVDYGRARGSVGTGAAGRDFANQAQGLGGLVRLYATYAANLFAVGAAFRALSLAMETSNMVRGLDQLGAASGTALGSLSKRLVEATDGAVSLREAMEATVKASSSGMSTDNILRMGEVAKKASMALGVDMSDALSRISRGITKLEPELLDEIGIFTRLDPAVKEYAKSMGKAVSQVTDFERRMAFANAVLAEGEKKFGEIKMDANPYTKLLASVKDLAQRGGELINKFIAPVVGYLSQSPAALGTAIAALVGILIKQAIPALGQFKAGLAESAATALDNSLRKAEDATAALSKLRDINMVDINNKLDDQVNAVDRAEQKILETRKKGIRKNSALYRATNEVDPAKVAEKDLKAIDRQAAGLRADAAKATSAAIAKGLKAEADGYSDLTTSIRAYQAGVLKADDIAKASIADNVNGMGRWSAAALTVRAAETAKNNAIKSSIVSNAAYNSSLVGITGAFKLMQAEIKTSGLVLGAFGRTALYVKGALAILGGFVGTMLGALGGVMQIIGLVVAAFSMLDGVLSKAGKETEAFSGAIDRLEGASKTVTDTIERMYKGNVFSLESMQAQANATIELADSMEGLAKSATKALDAVNASPWDKFKDIVKGAFGGGIQKNFSKALSEQLVSAIEDLESGPIKTKLSASLGALLNVKDTGNFDEIRKAISKLDPSSSIFKELVKLLKGVGMEAGIAASNVKEFSDSFDKSTDSFKALAKAYEVKSPVVTWATEGLDSLLKLRKVLQGPVEESLSSLVKLTSKLADNPIFGKDASIEMSKYSGEMSKVAKEINDTTIALANLSTEREKANKKYLFAEEYASRNSNNVKSGEIVTNAKSDLKAIDDLIKKRQAEYAKGIAEAQRIAIEVKKNITTGIVNSIGLVQNGIATALAKGSTQALQSIYSLIDNIPELASRQEELKLQELANDASIIKASQAMATMLRENTAQVAVQTATLEKDIISREKERVEKDLASGAGGVQANLRKLDSLTVEEATANDSLAAAKQAKGLITTAGRDPNKALEGLKTGVANGNSSLEAYTSTVIAAANESQGFIKALSDIGRQQQLIKDINIPIAEEKARTKAVQDRIDSATKYYSSEKATLDLRKQSGEISEEEYLIQNDTVNRVLESLRYSKEYTALASKRQEQLYVESGLRKQNEESDANLVRSNAEYNFTTAEGLALIATRINDKKREFETAKALIAIEQERYAKEVQLQEIKTDIGLLQEKLNIDSLEASLAYMEAEGTSSENILKNKRDIIALAKIEYEEREALIKLEQAYYKNVLPLAKRIASTSVDDTKTTDMLVAEIQLLYDKFNIESKGAKARSADAKAHQDMISSMTADQREFADAVKESFDSMADALTDFVMTGKMDFNSLANSIISDMMRIAIQQSVTRPLANMATSFIGSLFMADGGAFNQGTQVFAKGGAFSQAGPVMEFAKGDAFTNSIVSSPTLFKFAQGTGLMGEAGPEAIMPLKRDSQGNLGVRTQGGGGGNQITINVIESSEKAGTQERKTENNVDMINVFVEKVKSAIASDINRGSGTVPGALSRTYGLNRVAGAY